MHILHVPHMYDIRYRICSPQGMTGTAHDNIRFFLIDIDGNAGHALYAAQLFYELVCVWKLLAVQNDAHHDLPC